jgi:hypothetical protein
MWSSFLRDNILVQFNLIIRTLSMPTKLLFLILSLPLAALGSANILISSNNGFGEFFSEGGSGGQIRSVGQSIRFGTAITVTDFALSILKFTGTPNPLNFDYRAEIWAFDPFNGQIIGSALWVSAFRTGDIAPSFTGLSINLAAGQDYLLLLTSNGRTHDAGYLSMFVNSNDSNPYSAGAVWLQSSVDSTLPLSSLGGPTPSNVNGTYWTSIAGSDLALSLNSSEVPEPATALPAFVVISGLAWLRRKH